MTVALRRAARALLLAAAWALAAGPAAAAEPAVPPGAAPPAALADEAAWKAEFADVCSRTQDAMSLTGPELAALVARCDRLAPRLEALPAPQRKVYQKRLTTCRDLYQFVLDARAAEAAR